MREIRNKRAYKVLVEKSEGKIPLGRLEYNIKMELRETGCEHVK
jgi:hypothetical protein